MLDQDNNFFLISLSILVTCWLDNARILQGEVTSKSLLGAKGLTSCFFYEFVRCRKLPKALREWQAFNELKKKIDDFNECCPLLELMANKAMKDRHWERLAALTGHTFEVESENFLLRNIMEAPLLENKEDIEVR